MCMSEHGFGSQLSRNDEAVTYIALSLSRYSVWRSRRYETRADIVEVVLSAIRSYINSISDECMGHRDVREMLDQWALM